VSSGVGAVPPDSHDVASSAEAVMVYIPVTSMVMPVSCHSVSQLRIVIKDTVPHRASDPWIPD
jgi:hypothetical protein